MNEFDIYRAIEEQCQSYGDTRLKEFLSAKEMSNEDLHKLRGEALAARRLLQALRNVLGYDPAQL